MEFVLVVLAILSAGMWVPLVGSPLPAARPVAVVAVVAADRVIKSRREERFDIRYLAFHHTFLNASSGLSSISSPPIGMVLSNQSEVWGQNEAPCKLRQSPNYVSCFPRAAPTHEKCHCMEATDQDVEQRWITKHETLKDYGHSTQ